MLHPSMASTLRLVSTPSFNSVSPPLMGTAFLNGVSLVFLVFLFDALLPRTYLPHLPKHRKEVFPVFLHTATGLCSSHPIQPKPRKPLLPMTYPLNLGQKENPLRLENPGSSVPRQICRSPLPSGTASFNGVSPPLMGTVSLNGVSPR